MTTMEDEATARAASCANGSDRSDDQGRSLPGPVTVSIVGLFILAIVATLYFAQSFLVPVVFAFLLALVLSPVVRFLKKRGVPAPATALVLVLTLLIVVASGAYSLSGPVAGWIDNAPAIGERIMEKANALRGTVDAVRQASEQMEQATQGETAAPEVVVKEPDLIDRAANSLTNMVASVGLTLVLVLFLLASGDLFYEKIVRVLPTLHDKKQALRIAFGVEREVSRYLATVFAINLCLGIWIGAGLWLAGMPNPVLWGALAFVLNFIPYLGALIGAALVGAVAFVTFDPIGQALLPPAIYLLSTTAEGQLLTPAVLGRRLEMNTVVVFLSVAFWGWLWGLVGAVIAVPILVLLKVFAQHVDGLSGLGEFLSERQAPAGEGGADSGEADTPAASPPRRTD